MDNLSSSNGDLTQDKRQVSQNDEAALKSIDEEYKNLEDTKAKLREYKSLYEIEEKIKSGLPLSCKLPNDDYLIITIKRSFEVNKGAFYRLSRKEQMVEELKVEFDIYKQGVLSDPGDKVTYYHRLVNGKVQSNKELEENESQIESIIVMLKPIFKLGLEDGFELLTDTKNTIFKALQYIDSPKIKEFVSLLEDSKNVYKITNFHIPEISKVTIYLTSVLDSAKNLIRTDPTRADNVVNQVLENLLKDEIKPKEAKLRREGRKEIRDLRKELESTIKKTNAKIKAVQKEAIKKKQILEEENNLLVKESKKLKEEIKKLKEETGCLLKGKTKLSTKVLERIDNIFSNIIFKKEEAFLNISNTKLSSAEVIFYKKVLTSFISSSKDLELKKINDMRSFILKFYYDDDSGARSGKVSKAAFKQILTSAILLTKYNEKMDIDSYHSFKSENIKAMTLVVLGGAREKEYNALCRSLLSSNITRDSTIFEKAGSYNFDFYQNTY